MYTVEISLQMESTLKLINTCVRNEDFSAFEKIVIPTLDKPVCFYSSSKVLEIKG